MDWSQFLDRLQFNDKTIIDEQIAQRAGAVRLQRGNDEILHDLDLGLPLQTGLRFVEGSARLGDIEPGFVLFEACLDVSDTLEVFVELVGVGSGETALHAPGLGEDGIQHATVLGDGGLALLQRHVIRREELVENLNRVVLTSDGFAALIPCQREAGTVSLQTGGVELDRGEPSVLPQMPGDDLVGGDAVGHVLAGHGIAIGAREPEGAAPVSFVGVLVRAALHHGDVRLVTGQRRKPFREFVLGASVGLVRKPGLSGDAEADAEKDTAFRGGGGSVEAAEAKRRNPSDSSAGSAIRAPVPRRM